MKTLTASAFIGITETTERHELIRIQSALVFGIGERL